MKPAANVFEIRHDVEPAPNPSSRILLGEERDKLGQPRVQLNWRVTGSSVFPTAGRANPTLTILALALRLDDRIVEEFA